MRIICLFLILLLWIKPVSAQTHFDIALQKKINAMFVQDQRWRIESNKLNYGKKSDYTEDTINSNMQQTDSLNMVEAKRIIKKYGFPGYDLVGEDGSRDFWAIIQHCDDDLAFQQQALKLMAIQVKRHNTAADNYALLQDRILVSQHREQIYGTQIHINPVTHHPQPFPIQDSLHVDARRHAVGLSPLSEYLKLFERK